MASVDFKCKMHGAGETKAHMRHNDKDMRMKDNHANENIDNAKTHLNRQGKWNYAETMKRYDERIAEIDANGNTNTRKDRVTCFGLNVPFPAHLDPTDGLKWTNKVIEIVAQKYGMENIMNSYLHYDEIHNYQGENGEVTSRPHIHIMIVPEHNGELNGKWFSKRTNITEMNNKIHEMTKREFDCDFMDGTKKKSKKTVEELKNESRYKALESDLKADYAEKVRQNELSQEEALKALKAHEATLKEQSDILEDWSKNLYAKEAELTEREHDLDTREHDLATREVEMEDEVERRAKYLSDERMKKRDDRMKQAIKSHGLNYTGDYSL